MYIWACTTGKAGNGKWDRSAWEREREQGREQEQHNNTIPSGLFCETDAQLLSKASCISHRTEASIMDGAAAETNYSPTAVPAGSASTVNCGASWIS